MIRKERVGEAEIGKKGRVMAEGVKRQTDRIAMLWSENTTNRVYWKRGDC